MIKPTIGRNVLVIRGNGPQAEPGMICFVHSDDRINVGGFDSNGQPFALTSLYLHQEDTPSLEIPRAEWMQFQKGQAQKSEELQRVLDERTPLR